MLARADVIKMSKAVVAVVVYTVFCCANDIFVDYVKTIELITNLMSLKRKL